MPELSTTDVQNYTGGRLDKDAAETARLLAAGLAAARSFCGWPVTPERTDTDLKIDGQGGRLLALPTLKLATDGLTELAEDGIALDVSNDLEVSARGLVRKRNGGWWTCRFAGIVVTMTHGFDTAPDFEAAVLSWIDRASLAPTGGRARVIGPFQYETDAMAPGSTFTQSERALLEQYRLERPA